MCCHWGWGGRRSWINLRRHRERQPLLKLSKNRSRVIRLLRKQQIKGNSVEQTEETQNFKVISASIGYHMVQQHGMIECSPNMICYQWWECGYDMISSGVCHQKGCGADWLCPWRVCRRASANHPAPSNQVTSIQYPVTSITQVNAVQFNIMHCIVMAAVQSAAMHAR